MTRTTQIYKPCTNPDCKDGVAGMLFPVRCTTCNGHGKKIVDIRCLPPIGETELFETCKQKSWVWYDPNTEQDYVLAELAAKAFDCTEDELFERLMRDFDHGHLTPGKGPDGKDRIYSVV